MLRKTQTVAQAPCHAGSSAQTHRTDIEQPVAPVLLMLLVLPRAARAGIPGQHPQHRLQHGHQQSLVPGGIPAG
jgi:hypothetical protein